MENAIRCANATFAPAFGFALGSGMLCAFGSVWYLWSRAVGGGINGEPLVLPGGLTRYFGGMLLAYEIVALGFG